MKSPLSKKKALSWKDCFKFFIFFPSFTVSVKCPFISSRSTLTCDSLCAGENRSSTRRWCQISSILPLNDMWLWHVGLTSCLWYTSGLIIAARQLGAPVSSWQGQLCRCRRSRRAEMTQSNRKASSGVCVHHEHQLTETEPLAHYLLEIAHTDGGHLCSPVPSHDAKIWPEQVLDSDH